MRAVLSKACHFAQGALARDYGSFSLSILFSYGVEKDLGVSDLPEGCSRHLRGRARSGHPQSGGGRRQPQVKLSYNHYSHRVNTRVLQSMVAGIPFVLALRTRT